MAGRLGGMGPGIEGSMDELIAESWLEPDCSGTHVTAFSLDNIAFLSKKKIIFLYILNNNWLGDVI